MGTSLTVINRENDGSFGSENKVVKSLGNVLIPQYNKSLRGGRGDREAESQWINATGKTLRKESKKINAMSRKESKSKINIYRLECNKQIFSVIIANGKEIE